MKLLEFVMFATLVNLFMAGLPVLGLDIHSSGGGIDIMLSSLNESVQGGTRSEEQLRADGTADCSTLTPEGSRSMACNIQLQGKEIVVEQGSVESQKTFIDNIKMIIRGITTFFDMFGQGVWNPGRTYVNLMESMGMSNILGESRAGMNFLVYVINTLMLALYGIAAVQLLTGRDLRAAQ